ncbi:Hsp20/alpha crystallin family protein [Pseudonocardia alaniniphila]|uniref:Hsp20/alpha crystallin family protein n=1 Tax=Pseudonocardia alaniniphila TaxID=75291 RepID=A0ABS9T7L1_9PSEU|nr:Hsp20/alpha crystallin family protein [Pseudonocardia alaniniphila]MCH6164301.1 Hsp20/alpha crystallin family protein [Pseudonocardia alaniniphila]
MSSLMRRDRGGDVANRLNRMDRFLDEWMRALPGRRPFGVSMDWLVEDAIRVDQFREGDTEVIRAELPGIDPEKDIDLTVGGGVLRINAERRVEETTEDKGYLRHELRYGRFGRTLPLPDGVTDSDITATYKDGILEIHIPIPKTTTSERKKIEISKS